MAPKDSVSILRSHLEDSHIHFLEARLAARAERLTVHFLKSDIRNSSYHAEFDAAIALSSSFGRFPSEREDLRALEAVLRGLKPGAKLLIDLLNK